MHCIHNTYSYVQTNKRNEEFIFCGSNFYQKLTENKDGVVGVDMVVRVVWLVGVDGMVGVDGVVRVVGHIFSAALF